LKCFLALWPSGAECKIFPITTPVTIKFFKKSQFRHRL